MTGPAARNRTNSLAALPFCAPSVTVGAYAIGLTVFLPQYYAGRVGLSAVAVGNAFALVRLLDLWLDPFMGMLMDRTTTRLGRYRPWLLLGSFIIAGASYMAFMVEPGVSTFRVGMWLLVFYVGSSALTLAQSAWASMIAVSYDARSRMFSWLAIASVLGSAMVMALPKVLGIGDSNDPRLIHALGWFLVVGAPGGALLAAVCTREQLAVSRPHERGDLAAYLALIARPDVVRIVVADFFLALGPGGMAVLSLYFFRDCRHLSTADASLLLLGYMIAGLIGAPLIARTAVALGKHRTLMGACVGYALGLVVLFASPAGIYGLDLSLMVAMGLLAPAFSFLVRAMVADLGDQVRLETGSNQTSLLYSLIAATQKAAGALSVTVAFNALGLFHYATATGVRNSQAAIQGMGITYAFGPATVVCIGALCLLGYRLNAERHRAIRAALEQRDAGLSVVEAPIAALEPARP